MQLKLSTDYAIRIIVYLAEHGRTTSLELSKKLNISQNYIKKLMSQSSLSQFIVSTPGSDGGLELIHQSHEITLFDIIDAMEEKLMTMSCLEDKKGCVNCETFQKATCLVYKCFQEVQRVLKETLSNITVEDFINPLSDLETKEKWVNERCIYQQITQ